MITALAGGVGAARFLTGLVHITKQEDLTAIVNTGDDIELLGLHISPDLDIITYTLAGIVDDEKGWGIKGDTYHCLETLRNLGQETWFGIGDKDLATSILRSSLLKNGKKLSEITSKVSHALGVKVNILPMTDDWFETQIVTKQGLIHFQEYLVKRGAIDEVLGVKFVGVDVAQPAVGVIEALSNAEKIIVCPSNPIVSIGTILSIKDIRETLQHTRAKKIAVSPIVAGAPIKGPANKLLKGLGLEVSAYSVAKLYADFLDVFVIDVADKGEKDRIQGLGVEVRVTNTIMRALADKVSLAKIVLED